MKTETSLHVVRDGEEESRTVTQLRKCHLRGSQAALDGRVFQADRPACMKVLTLASNWNVKAKEGRLLRPDWLVSWGRETAGETRKA